MNKHIMNQTGFVLYASLVLDILAISALFVSVILWNAAFWGLLFTTFVIHLYFFHTTNRLMPCCILARHEPIYYPRYTVCSYKSGCLSI